MRHCLLSHSPSQPHCRPSPSCRFACCGRRRRRRRRHRPLPTDRSSQPFDDTMTAHNYQQWSQSSINASMDDFEARDFSPTVPDLPSQHSGFRSPQTSEYSETNSSRRSYSPPAWRKAGSGWFKHQSLSPVRSGARSKEPSPGEEDDMTAFRIPLPESPTKGRSPSNSPDPELRPAEGHRLGEERGLSPVVHASVPATPTGAELDSPLEQTPTQSNCKALPCRIEVNSTTFS